MTDDLEKALVVVDGYSSGSQLPKVMAEIGWKCVHVQSTDNLSSYFLKWEQTSRLFGVG